ncbi:hypothetical protein JW930_03235 [Candidatus Woesearchaeota archaeon]|nr:hypothetical protein [Candidatus Woesearchaeota archaeon]
MKKKSQIAIETLMIYGAVILIVMLAIGALVYFGVLDLGSYLPDKCNLPGQIKCENWRISTNQIELELRNSVGKNIIISGIEFTGVDDWNTVGCTATSGETVNNGDLKLYTLDANLDTNHECSFPPGKKVKGTLTVTYNIVGSLIDQPLQGQLQAKVG